MPTVNLLPERLVITQMRRRHIRRWAVACVTAAGLLSVPVGVDLYRDARAGELTVEFQSLSSDRDRAQAELTGLVAKSRETFLQLERAKALRTKRSWSGMIALLGESMPDGCWLVELSTDPPAPSGQQPRAADPAKTPTTASEPAPTTVVIDAPRRFRIVGFASEPGEPYVFVRNLKASGAFESVDLERTQREPVADGYYFRFEIACGW